jgi:hypothetical protein
VVRPVAIVAGAPPTLVAAVNVPPGQYVVQAKGQLASALEGGMGQIRCRLHALILGVDLDLQTTSTLAAGFTTTALLGSVSLASAEQLQLLCDTPSTNGTVSNAELAALEFATLESH